MPQNEDEHWKKKLMVYQSTVKGMNEPVIDYKPR